MNKQGFCGNHERRTARAALAARWNKSQLAWCVQTDLPGILRDAFRAAVAEALASWAAVCGLTFAESAATQADILIATGPIDGPQGVLAWSELPPARPVHQRYDTAERWVTAAGQGIRLPTVVAHELGHAFGLDHDDPRSGSLMAPTYSDAIVRPQPRDVARIQALYGKPTTPPMPPPGTPVEALVLRLFPNLKVCELPPGWTGRAV